MRRWFFTRVAAVLLVGFSAIASAAEPEIFVFGDSLSDTGNSYQAGFYPFLISPYYALGKFTDSAGTFPPSQIEGLWIEQLAPMLGLPVPTLYTAGGGIYAYAGAVTGLTGRGVVPGVKNQVAYFLRRYPTQAPADSLYIVWAGSNDLFDATTASELPAAKQTAILNLKNVIGRLAERGAKKFVWLNVPPLGDTPKGIATGFPGALNGASAQFRTNWTKVIPQLESTYPGIKITAVDLYSFFLEVMNTPEVFGLSNATDPAQGTLVNPDEFLFWDALHPTTAAGTAIATLVYDDLTKKPQSITFSPVGDRLISDPPFRLGAKASSGLPITYHILSGPATVSGNLVTLTGLPGKVIIEATQAGDANYAPASEVTTSFRVNRVSPR